METATAQEIKLEAQETLMTASIGQLLSMWRIAGGMSIREGRFVRQSIKTQLTIRLVAGRGSEEASAALVLIGA